MYLYPYTTPQVLNDNEFVKYGGQTGTSTLAQREAAYLLAEEQMTEHLGTFLLPTTTTGTAKYIDNGIWELPLGNVTSIFSITFNVIKSLQPLATEMYTGTAVIINPQRGYILTSTPAGLRFGNYTVDVVYESGLPSGTAADPALMSALVMAAQINLNEWDASLSNEGTADVGIQAFSNQSYSEQRKPLLRTVFGDSAFAQRISRLTKRYRAKVVSRFR
jgi:hypothetical protein